MGRIRRGKGHLLWIRHGLRVRYGYEKGLVTVWGDWRWTHWGAKRELMAALRAVKNPLNNARNIR